ncbi:hypothetical protein CRENBAI_020273 [Crenichthys baileyi]|uniref:Uncharacterized protein n=1 Tax=Crenichthys baileyi TaxID=28760 RepID=A0AAV9RII8_9TELE
MPRRPELRTTAQPIGRNDGQRPVPNPKAQGCNPFIHWGKPQHEMAELGGNKQTHRSLPPLPVGHSRVEESPAPLEEMGSRAHASQSKHPGIGLPRSPPSSAAQSSLHQMLTVPPAGSGPSGGWPRISHSGLAPPGPARSNPATKRSLTDPDPSPGSRVGPQLRHTRRRHVPRSCGPHEGVLNRSLSDPSPRACLPWETLPGAFKPKTT